MAGYLGSTPVPQGIKETQSFTATAGQTTFNTLGYSNGNNISVFLNGVRLINGTDYTATNGSDIVLTAAASASDVLDFETFNEFNLVNQNLTTPTFTDSASVTSTTTASVSVSGDTTATLNLKNNTHEDTDGGRESTVIFQGEQSGGEISTLAEIEASHDSSADDEKGNLVFRTNDGSDGSSPTERLKIDSAGVVSVGTASGTQPSYFNSFLNVQNNASTSDHASITITSGTGGFAGLHFGDSANGRIGQVAYNNADDVLIFTANNSERVRVQSGGGISFNGDTAAANALDDYEEGTWTPAISSGGSSFAYAVQQGRYTKIGDLVHVKFYLQLSSGTMTSAQFGVGNFPFASASVHYTIGSGWNNASSSSVAHPVVLLTPNSTSVLFYTQGGQNLSAVSGSTLGSSTSQLWSFTYYV